MTVSDKPGNRLWNTLMQAVDCLEAEELFCTANVQAPSRLPVGFRGVPGDFPCIADLLCNHVSEFPNANFLSRPKIDWLTTVVPFRREHYSFGGVLDLEEFARG